MLCQKNRSILKLVFRWFRRIHCAYESLRYLDLKMWRFSWWWRWQTDRQTKPIALPLAHARGVIITVCPSTPWVQSASPVALWANCGCHCQFGSGKFFRSINSANIWWVRNKNSHQLLRMYTKCTRYVGVPEQALMWFSCRYYKPNQPCSWHCGYSWLIKKALPHIK